MNISILFTIIFIIFYLILTIITIKERRSSKVAYGDDNNKKLIKAIRAHANFFEFTVFFIISSFLLEILDANQIYVLFVNIIFLLGRISHAYSMLKEKTLFRVIGMMATLNIYALNCIYLLYLYVQYFNQLD
ncbi:COG3788 Uncharacterized relative of glutathione S-transferase, MAPEG superfamily [Candidatus Pelagibacterales bacterium]|jgi:uncharacterized membrane protein YecN with MAPEG domain